MLDEDLLAKMSSLQLFGRDQKTAHHEAGHALVALQKDTGRTVSYASVIPKGMYGGIVAMLEAYEDINQTDIQANHDIMMYLAGGVAEQICGFSKETILNNLDSGFLDLLDSNNLSIDLTFARERARYLIKNKNKLNENEIDFEVDCILKKAYIETIEYLQQNKSQLIFIADLLLQEGILSGKELSQRLHDNNRS